MQETKNRNADEWVRCKKCGHKLFKVISRETSDKRVVMEVKCHSCKEINIIKQ